MLIPIKHFKMNLFTVHAKNGLYIYKCQQVKSEEGQDLSKNENLQEEEKKEPVTSLRAECVWYQDRFARHCICSQNNNLCIVDDRSGLSIVYTKNNLYSDFSMDTLRGVGKFKNMYTPLGCKNIKHLQWSKNGTYLVVYFNLTNYSESGLCLEDNLHIWDISKKNIIGTFNTKRLSPEQWPVTKWIGSTDNFALCHNHQVGIYSIVSEGSSLKSVKLLLTVRIPMVFIVDLSYKPMETSVNTFSDGDNIFMAAFSQPDSSHSPGNLRISTLKLSGDSLLESSFSQHELKFTDSAELLWSPSGNYLIILAQSTVDLAGEKYGSTTNCILFSSNGKYISKVNSYTTHDARWNPKSDIFILMEGNMPCKITLYNVELETLFEFPNMYRNTIKWNPLGNMVALGGFGNLAGEICFWYKKEGGNEMEQIVQFKEPCTVISEWSLDSKYFITASTFPRMKVDNFFKIFNCEGYLMASEILDECYDVSWFCGNSEDTEFIRPKVRKSLDRKPIYRPKMSLKSTNPTSAKPFSKAPGSPLFTMSHQDNTFNMSNTRLVNTFEKNHFDNFNRSFFSGQFGNNSDPSTDLFQSFKHVFSLSFINKFDATYLEQRNNQEQFFNRKEQQVDTRDNFNTSDSQFQNTFDNQLINNFQNQMIKPLGNQFINMSDSQPNMSGQMLSVQENQYNNMTDGFFDNLQQVQYEGLVDNQQMSYENGLNYTENTSNQLRDDSENVSMFVRLKNQLQSEKMKTRQRTIMNEGQLLRLLFEAKNKRKPDSLQS
uniref:Eukaryotic translation initiation factor 2A n=1 Tax=Theileria annulata TaxID=5874 RepID=A0A3B0MP96_THEAN